MNQFIMTLITKLAQSDEEIKMVLDDIHRLEITNGVVYQEQVYMPGNYKEVLENKLELLMNKKELLVNIALTSIPLENLNKFYNELLVNQQDPEIIAKIAVLVDLINKRQELRR